ncbi:hypothetical protein BDW59DRAFT_64246 [Aspergillus cavernicola]|uniref:Uncharacterized protein n=1 Tax=Aspergillus cavernicola TaxID=176166 RepID=A0ABR4J3X2_9EURO
MYIAGSGRALASNIISDSSPPSLKMGIFLSTMRDCTGRTTTINESESSTLLNIILTSPTVQDIRKSSKELIHPESFTASLAETLLSGLAMAIKQSTPMAEAATEALARATDAAFEFSKEHPFYITILAIGVLVTVLPWVLEVLGFADLGIVEGSWAASWQAKYAGYVRKGSLFSFLQRLGMVWHMKAVGW